MTSWKPRTHGGLRGFTLMELIVVITIIGILGTIVLVKVVGRVAQTREVKAKADLRAIYQAAQQYYLDTSYWPQSIDDLINPTHPETGDPIHGGLEKRPLDPWLHEYEYELLDGRAIVRCLGADQSQGGEGENMDYEYPERQDGF